MADDDLNILCLLHDALALEGYSVAGASNTDTALVILDLWLDARDAGWCLLEWLWADPATARLPLIVSSADAISCGRRRRRCAISAARWWRSLSISTISSRLLPDAWTIRVAHTGMTMYDEDLNSPALWSYADDAQFNERLAALATYRELRERRWRRTMQPGDRERLRAAREVLERTGGIPATWQDTR